ncbi:MAG: PEP-CTERM sorting domain-containing protein [Planctomycetes bacterium]|nr:PEP-CTERM sorting domain-containing protein [Planctomycetota bacterium]MCH8210857.1 PEP-CTERM sorting domain-containing protein [Planctomycetota bacterium]
MSNSTRTIAAAAAAILTGAAQADLMGTSMDMELVQSGFAGNMAGPTGGSYTYGTLDTFGIDELFTWDVVSPGLHPAFDNSILLDFSNFGYAAYIALGPSISTLDVTNIAEDVEIASPAVFLLSDLNTNIAQSTSTLGNSFSVGWDVETVINGNPLAPSVIVGWNSAPVPAPGAMALLGLAGLTVIRRRRRC